MKALALLISVVAAAPALAQAVSTDEAYQRLQKRTLERQTAAATQPAADQIATLQAENDRLRAIIADLQLELDAFKQGGAVAAHVAAPTTATPPADYPPAGRTYTGGYTSRTSATQAVTSIPEDRTPGQTYVGPRGGVYHYSKNGNKVYEKHK